MQTSPRRGLLANGDFVRLWAGQTISQFGSQITFLALPLIAATILGAGPLEMGVLGAAEMAPFLLIGLPAGVWVDRLPRRPILILGDLGRGLALATIPLAYLVGGLSLPQLYAVAFATGTLTVFFDVAYMAYLPSLVKRDQLVEGNSKLEATRAAGQIAGPGVAGTLVQTVGAPLAILVDSLSFLVSALFLALIRTRETIATAEGMKAGMREEIGEGLRYVMGHSLLRPIALATGSFNLFGSAAGALFILFAVKDLAVTPAALGLVFAVANVGMLIGALAAGRLSQRLGLGTTIILGATLSSLGEALVPLATTATAVAVLLAGQVFFGLGVMFYNITQVSLRQSITPLRLQGRMNATMRFVVWGTMPIGSLLGGAAGEALGLRLALFITAGGAVLSVLWLVFSPIRSLRATPGPAPD